MSREKNDKSNIKTKLNFNFSRQSRNTRNEKTQ